MERLTMTGVVLGPVAMVGMVVLGLFAMGRDHWFTAKASRDGFEVTSSAATDPKPDEEL